MNRIDTLLCAITFPIAVNACYAADSTCTTRTQNDLYPPVLLDNNVAIRFEMAKESVDPHGDIYPITVIEQQCDTGSEKQVAELPYLGDPGKVESAFLEDSDFDGVSELFVIHRTTLYSDTGISYDSDYFTTLIYNRLAPLKYELNERVSVYFGSGGDILSSPTNDDLIYEHPYKSKAQIKNQLASPKYRIWLEQKPITTRITRKTYLYDQANTADRTTNYLITGDQVQVLDQQAGWLEAVFHNKKKGDIKGWILCKDTLECSDQNLSTEK
ncbi:hypothetical protein HP532_14170 [Pseudomonas sp. CrR25]|nr:hypothetical protein [Pseudomonas sp. CrR25]